MIKNQKQAEITRKKIIELKETLVEFEKENPNKTSAKYELGKNSFDGLIKDLENQVAVYDGLVAGNFHCWKAESLEEIPEILISARLAQNKSQKDLGELLGSQEQQIQRYEASDYETASWTKIVEVAMALNLKFRFEQIIIMDEKVFDFDGKTQEKVEVASEKVKRDGLLIF